MNYKKILQKYRKDRTRLIEILKEIQAREGHISEKAIICVADELGLSRAEVEGVISFYHFLSARPLGKYVVYLNNSITAEMAGREKVALAWEREIGCRFGQTSEDGLVTLLETSCIGMNDQEPAAIINGVVFTSLNPDKVKKLVGWMREGRAAEDMVEETGDGANGHELVRAMVRNNIRKTGPVVFGEYVPGQAIGKALETTPECVIDEVKRANLLGRGGAGFPTGLKWEFCRKEKGEQHFVICNADEGEPGTFKDRVILTERPEMVFEGMAIAGYAVGARLGILYLRHEYTYLRRYLEHVLQKMREQGWLGKNIAGRGFDFDIEIKMGAGAYVCGEESALIESAEGKRGEPRDRPPFPVQKGYLNLPSTVNNVETLATATQIITRGASWFRSMGTPVSAGTKLLSVSGDCERPGIYEVEYGLTVKELLEMVGAKDTLAVQVGGPSGNCISEAGFGRKICFSDLPTGGSIIIFNRGRDLFSVVRNFLDFFIEESCGWCVPCRAGNVLLKKKFEKIASGLGTVQDLKEIEAWGKIIKSMSRCGLGQTSPNPVLTTLASFRELYESRVNKEADFIPEFDLSRAVAEASAITGRKFQEEQDHA
ncbi:MAG: Group 3d [NiFe] NAD-reducing hydrogenase subunit HoxF [Candidatus Saccharicenans subterraneus]|uniref:Group 3d [NiFe] NAD-reducing hydrogenase subunit HoxF n=1 Tax=Candidatus Saccharicenans subterraneus TaxID=2508984 RepID=A0A3E2BQH2_9BACT|nr:MAG: Group 3d [NiFe] NAD-reducing hydrogenase subunit HoxF [Candidatus Saccharicenans subterraneum]